ncbi:MAG: VTT domain-containing protein [Elusimicrobia bacterium]|nr:VTT domain-containing protein [Elusimicrobiota bacterium]
MIAEITQWILELLRTHGPTSVFVGVIIESVIVPIPSPLIIMGAGAILIAPDISLGRAALDILLLIVLPGSIASTLGAFIGYGIGFWGGRPLIEKLKGFLGFDWNDVEAMEQRWTGKKIGWSIFLLRALPVIPLSLISAAGGVIRLPVVKFTWWTFLGSVPRCLLLGFLGDNGVRSSSLGKGQSPAGTVPKDEDLTPLSRLEETMLERQTIIEDKPAVPPLDGARKYVTSLNPATLEEIGKIPVTTREEVLHLVAAARKACQ